MSVTQTTQILFDFGATAAQERTRTTSKATTKRITIDFRSQPVVANLSPRDLGRPVAEAIAEAMKDAVRGITATASDSTLVRRVSAVRALAAGKKWAKARYTGGRTKGTAPNSVPGDKLFNDSGRLVKGIVVGATKDGGPDGEAGWTVNVTKNRLDPSTFQPAQFEAMLRRLVELVPMLGDSSRLMQVPYVATAVNDAARAVVTKAGSASMARLIATAKETKNKAVEVGEAVGEFNDGE